MNKWSKVIWHKAASLQQASVQSYSPVAPMCPPLRAHWRHVPSGEGTLAPPGEYDWTCASFGLPMSTSKTASRSVKPFLHSSLQNSLYFTMGAPFPKNCPVPMGGPGLHRIYDSLGPWLRTHNPNGISIGGSAVFTGLTTVTDRQTDRRTNRPRYSVGNNRPRPHRLYVR